MSIRSYGMIHGRLTLLLSLQNAALGAFLPQSVAAFAGEVPSSMYTKKGLQAMLR